MGAGLPENQAAIGASDPQEAARRASLDPTAAAREEREEVKRDEHLEDLVAELTYAIDKGEYVLPAKVPSLLSLSDFLRQSDIEQVEQWHDQMVALREKRIDEEIEGTAGLEQSLREQLRVQPDDPMYEPLRDEARRKAIEENLEPLDFGQMLFKKYVEQDIPVSEHLTIRMRSIKGTHQLWMEEYAAQADPTNYQHISHWYSTLQVGVALQSINGTKIEPSLDRIEDKEHFWKVMEKRAEAVTDFPAPLVDDFIVQHVWFMGRIRKMLAGNLARKVGNS